MKKPKNVNRANRPGRAVHVTPSELVSIVQNVIRANTTEDVVKAGAPSKVALLSATDAPPVSAFVAAIDALNSLAYLENRLTDLTDRLLGARPTEASGGTDAASPNGTLPVLHDHATYAAARVERMHNMLTRIERELP